MKYLSAKKLTYLLVLPLFICVSCGTPYQPEEQDDEEQEEQIPETNEVLPDGILETVTWNLEWYGSGFSGPPDFEQQTKNIVQVLDSLDADLFAFQEVQAQEDLDNIVDKMKSYRGFIADHVGQSQKMAFAYNTTTIDSLSAGAITSDDVGENYQSDWNYNWASGRTPMYFTFDYTYEQTTQTFYAIVVHGISNFGDDKDEDYTRRKKAAEGLYHYLNENKPDANIILLGDYNDDVDVSIYDDNSETPYYSFVDDTQNFDVITKKLSDSGESASVNYEDLIDHITISNEVTGFHVSNSTAVYDAPQSYIDNYGETTSDHLPVWAKFDVTKSGSVTKQISP